MSTEKIMPNSKSSRKNSKIAKQKSKNSKWKQRNSTLKSRFWGEEAEEGPTRQQAVSEATIPTAQKEAITQEHRSHPNLAQTTPITPTSYADICIWLRKLIIYPKTTVFTRLLRHPFSAYTLFFYHLNYFRGNLIEKSQKTINIVTYDNFI